MEKLRWLADFHGELDEVALEKTLNKLNLHPLDLLAVAAKIVECRNRKKQHHHGPQIQKQITQIIDDDEAAMLKHEKNLETQKRKTLSCSPSKKPYTHDFDQRSVSMSNHGKTPISTLSCTPSNKKPNSQDVPSKADRLRREKKLKKPMIEEDESFPDVSLSSKGKRASNPNNNQGILKIKKPLHGPILSPTPLSFVLPLSKNRKKSKKDTNKLKKKKKKLTYKGPDTPPDLPIEFRNLFSQMGGSEIQLLIQKPLYKADITHGQSRLSMPASQIKARNFVREEEWVTTPSKQGDGFVSVVENVPIIDTRLRTGFISLRMWNLFKDNNTSRVMYVLSTTWNDLVKTNQLKCGNIVQVWSFRVGSGLNLAIVLVEDCVFVEDDESGCGTASSTSNEADD